MKIVEIINTSNNPLPAYGTEDSAGLDIRANLVEPFSVPPNHSAIIPTGLSVAIPKGYELQIRPRSGLAAKNIVTVLNSPGTIDADYRGEVQVIIMNHGNADFLIEPGDRIAQGVLNKFEQIKWKKVKKLSTTKRGEKGIGSTGKK